MLGLILDADAIAAYARGSLRVGREVSRVAEQEGDVFVPSLCLAEAYRLAEGRQHDYLAVLASHPHVTVIPLEEPGCWVVGGFAKRIGSLHLAQATAETGARPTITLLTAHRDRVTEHLPKEWPIIDL
ncbi:MAG: hypothetical protein ACRDT2_10685 [Natronosporangium sp.]